MIKQFFKTNYFSFALVFLCGSYLIFEFFFNAYAMIFADEFWFAHAAYQFKSALPYKDFMPYKTVLGYYFLLLPLLLGHTKSLIAVYIFVKNCITITNILVLFSAAIYLRKFFPKIAVLLSLALLITSENALLYSTNIRVDLFAYWFCLFSLLCVLDKRFLIAGLLLGAGFAISQKVIWYFAAINFAFMLQWLLLQRDRKSLRAVLTFNLSFITVVSLYLLFWASFSSLVTVIDSVFFEAKLMYQLDWYAVARIPFWALVIFNNPLLFLLWPVTVFSFMFHLPQDHFFKGRLFLFCIAICLFACLIPYKQVFPYYMQVMFPIFITLYASFFDWLFLFFRAPNTAKITTFGQHFDWFLAVMYLTILFFLVMWLQLLKIYLSLSVLPFLLIYMSTKIGKLTQPTILLAKQFTLLIFLFIGFVYPLTMFIPALANVNGNYQKANLRVLNAILQEQDDYIAGTDLLFYKTQPIVGMQHLNGPAVNFLHEPFSPKLRAAMISSLNFDPSVTVYSIMNEINKSQVKAYINNYRMREIPKTLKEFLATQYQHYWGSIYIYAPMIPAGKQNFSVKFSAEYKVMTSEKNQKVMINGKQFSDGDTLKLSPGKHSSTAEKRYRLQLMPDHVLTDSYPKQYQADDWIQMI